MGQIYRINQLTEQNEMTTSCYGVIDNYDIDKTQNHNKISSLKEIINQPK